MTDDPKYQDWIALQAQILTAMRERRAAGGGPAWDAKVAALQADARPLWDLLSTRYDDKILNGVVAAMWEASE